MGDPTLDPVVQEIQATGNDEEVQRIELEHIRQTSKDEENSPVVEEGEDERDS